MLLREIIQEARNLTKAERCSVFLVDQENNELVAKVFDGDIQEKQVGCRCPVNFTSHVPASCAFTTLLEVSAVCA